MKSLNETLKEISIIKILIIAIVAIFAMVIIEEIIPIVVPTEFLNICLLIYIVYKVKDCKQDAKLEIKNVFSNFSFKLIVGIVILNIFFSYGMIYLSDFLLVLVPGLDIIVYSTASTNASIFYAGSLISTILIAPISEELVFRGVIFNRLNKHFSISVAIIASSLLFGICHDFGGIVSAFVFGICMCLLYIKTSNIFVPMFAHGLNNLISEIISLLDYDNLIFTNDIVILIIIILAIISAYILFISIKYEWKKLT